MFCRSCGKENDDGAKFCRGCGLPIVPVEETIEPDFSEEKIETPVAEDSITETEMSDVAGTTAETPVEETPVQEAKGTYQSGPIPQGQPYPGGPAPQGQPYQGAPGQPYGQPGPQAAYAAQGQNAKPPASSASILSLIFGIISVVCCCGGILGVGFGIAAICIAVSDKKKNGQSGLGTAGLVLGIVGISLTVIFIIWFFVSGAFVEMLEAIRLGRLSDYINHFGDWGSYSSYGF